MGYTSYQSGGSKRYGTGGGYQKTAYQQPPKPEFNLEEEAGKYVVIYNTMKGLFEEAGIDLAEIKDYLGGWVSGIKISWDKSL